MVFKKTNSEDADFLKLVNLLDKELAEYDGEEHAFYDQFNKVQNLKHCIIALDNDKAIGCGAIKKFDDRSMEVKRMYVLPQARGKGYSKQVLQSLESWAKDLGFSRIVLETGKRQVPAVNLYRNMGYNQTENYAQYIGIENSLCFEKFL